MLSMFNKKCVSTLLAVLSLSSSSLLAWGGDCCDPCDGNRFYIGAFGGGIKASSTNVYQFGTAFFPYENDDGPLAVNAHGHLKSNWSGLGGFQVGYEWLKCPTQLGCTGWTLTPGAEFEAYWFSHKRSGHLINDTFGRLDEHDFHNHFHINSTVLLANVIFSFNSPCGFSPYVGVGLGAKRLNIKNASSYQVDPLEADINHFNSRRNDSNWAFAAQAKVGLRYKICDSFHVFGEYRYLFVDTSNYLFGSTNYEGHVPTSPWNVKIRNTNYNAIVFGIQWDL